MDHCFCNAANHCTHTHSISDHPRKREDCYAVSCCRLQVLIPRSAVAMVAYRQHCRMTWSFAPALLAASLLRGEGGHGALARRLVGAHSRAPEPPFSGQMVRITRGRKDIGWF